MTRAHLARSLLVFVGVAVGLLLGELALRLTSPDLPSLAVLGSVDRHDREEFQRWSDPPDRISDDCTVGDRPGPRKAVSVQKIDATEREGPRPAALDLWVAGDSVVQGWGVHPSESYPAQLAHALSATRDRPVRLRRLGTHGVGYCGWLANLDLYLSGEKDPDAVVLQLFADDLELRNVVLIQGRPVAQPGRAEPAWLRPFVVHSYLANRLWLAHLTHLAPPTPRRHGDRATFLRALSQATTRLDARDIPWVLALVPPAGIGRCTQASEPWSDCAWLQSDLDLMADWLGGSLPFLDLRDLWTGMEPSTLEIEETAWRARGRLPVHPGREGHAELARRIWPALEAALEPRSP